MMAHGRSIVWPAVVAMLATSLAGAPAARADRLAYRVASKGDARVTKINDDLWQVSIPQRYQGVVVRDARLAATISHGNLVLMGAEGWGNVRELDATPRVSAAQALDAIREVGPGGHYLGCAHTQANFKTAFWRSAVLDYKPFEAWADEGGRDSQHLAHLRAQRTLAEYQAPPIDPAVDEALRAYMAERKASEPDAFA